MREMQVVTSMVPMNSYINEKNGVWCFYEKSILFHYGFNFKCIWINALNINVISIALDRVEKRKTFSFICCFTERYSFLKTINFETSSNCIKSNSHIRKDLILKQLIIDLCATANAS